MITFIVLTLIILVVMLYHDGIQIKRQELVEPEPIGLAVMRMRQKHLREHPTLGELKAKRILEDLEIGHEFQAIVDFYIVDFVDHARGLVLEIDGGVHDTRDVYDDRRSGYLAQIGYDVYRLTNEDVNVENIKRIWKIK